MLKLCFIALRVLEVSKLEVTVIASIIVVI